MGLTLAGDAACILVLRCIEMYLCSSGAVLQQMIAELIFLLYRAQLNFAFARRTDLGPGVPCAVGT
jgi:hypothetical protein